MAGKDRRLSQPHLLRKSRKLPGGGGKESSGNWRGQEGSEKRVSRRLVKLLETCMGGFKYSWEMVEVTGSYRHSFRE